jgi:hypothetical protein
MKTTVGMGLALVICGAVEAADPPRSAIPASDPPVASAPAVIKPLHLHIGDIRNYMMPNDFAAAINAPNEDNSTVVVEGKRVLAPMKSVTDVPGGIVAPFWAIGHPLQAWRIFAPVVNAPVMRQPYDKIPPPIFRWGP